MDGYRQTFFKSLHTFYNFLRFSRNLSHLHANMHKTYWRFFLILNLDSLRNSSGGAIWAHTPLCYELTCGKHFVDITNVADFSRLSLYNSQLMLCRILPVELFDYWVPFLEKIQEFGKIAVLRNM